MDVGQLWPLLMIQYVCYLDIPRQLIVSVTQNSACIPAQLDWCEALNAITHASYGQSHLVHESSVDTCIPRHRHQDQTARHGRTEMDL